MNDQRLSVESKALLLKCFDEPLAEDEVLRLAELLRSSSVARDYYLNAVQMHSDLTAQGEAVQLAREIFSEFPASDDKQEVDAGLAVDSNESEAILTLRPQVPSPSTVRRFLQWSKLPYAALVLASGMFLGCGIGIVAASAIYERASFTPIEWSRTVQDDAVARVAATHDCEWQSSESPETLPTRSLHVGQQIRIEKGLLQIVYRNGLGVVLSGPAVYEVQSDSGGKLYMGAISVTAPRLENAFVLETQQGAVQINDGRMGVEVDEDGVATCAAIVGEVLVELSPLDDEEAVAPMKIGAGQAVHIDSEGWAVERPLSNIDATFVHEMPVRQSETFHGDTILLSNLFDDSTSSSLTEAMQSDAYQAAGETIDLGVAAVRDGGLDVDFPLVDGGVQFNLVNLGGNGQRVRGLPSNDTFRSVSRQAIRTSGKAELHQNEGSAKIEDGIGMSANEMLTFDLDEIRTAGGLQGLPLRFKVDRAGINDFHNTEATTVGSARVIAIVSTQSEVFAGYVNGQPVDVVNHAGVYRFAFKKNREFEWLERKNEFVQFDIELSSEAKFLTLISISGKISHDDHAVFSGARLEVVREQPKKSPRIPLQQASVVRNVF